MKAFKTLETAFNIALLGVCILAGTVVVIGFLTLNLHIDIPLLPRQIFMLIGSYFAAAFTAIFILKTIVGNPAQKERSRAGYVYLLRSASGAYKIGHTVDPKDRLHTFGIQLPFEVHYEHLIQCDDRKSIEAQLHKIYASKRVKGEWFNLSPEDVAFIKTLGMNAQRVQTKTYRVTCPICGETSESDKRKSVTGWWSAHMRHRHSGIETPSIEVLESVA